MVEAQNARRLAESHRAQIASQGAASANSTSTGSQVPGAAVDSSNPGGIYSPDTSTGRPRLLVPRGAYRAARVQIQPRRVEARVPRTSLAGAAPASTDQSDPPEALASTASTPFRSLPSLSYRGGGSAGNASVLGIALEQSAELQHQMRLAEAQQRRMDPEAASSGECVRDGRLLRKGGGDLL
jgi:hypothetical protein